MYVSTVSTGLMLYVHMATLPRVVEIDQSRVTVWDSLKKPPELYQNLIDIMQRAWSRFLKTQLGVTSTPTELEFNHNRPVQISHIYFHLFKQHEYFITCIYVYSVWDNQGTNLCGYYVCEHMHFFCRDTKRVTQENFEVRITLVKFLVSNSMQVLN